VPPSSHLPRRRLEIRRRDHQEPASGTITICTVTSNLLRCERSFLWRYPRLPTKHRTHRFTATGALTIMCPYQQDLRSARTSAFSEASLSEYFPMLPLLTLKAPSALLFCSGSAGRCARGTLAPAIDGSFYCIQGAVQIQCREIVPIQW
jgi:hypothetical protein